MVAAISGAGLGLYNTSATNLNGQGTAGSAPEGRTGEQVYVNTSTGNLVLQDDDQLLSAVGLDVAIVRTYNSQGTFNGGVGPNWRLGVEESLSGLTGTVNTAGSTITKTFGDGATVTYTYNSTSGLYTSSAGPAADDTLSYNAGNQQWTWTDSTSRTTEVYNSSGQIVSTTDSSGNPISYGYSGSLLTQISDASGQVTTFTYTNGNITQVATQSNSVTQTLVYYSYDSQGRLSQVKIDLSPQDNSISDGNTYVTTYTYQGSTDLVSSITQSDGTSISFTYQQVNGQYRVASYTDGLGHTTTLSYSASTGSVTANANTAALDGTGVSGQSKTASLNSAPLSTTTTQTTTTTTNLVTSALTTPTVGWSGPSTLPANATTAANTSIAYDGSGNAFAVWSSNGNLFAERYASATGTWSAPVLLDTQYQTVASPSLAVDAAGNAVVGWVQSDGTAQSAYVARYSASGGTWSAPVSLESTSNAVATAAGSIVTASNGTYGAVAWVQSDGTVNRLYASRWNGTSWSAATIVDAGNGNASAQPAVGIDASGNMTVLWQQSNGTANAIYSNRFSNSSGTWGGATQLSASSSTAANNAQIRLDSSGNAFAIWRQGGNLFERHYATSSGTWSTQTTLSVNTNAISAPSLSVDAAGNALAAWIQSNGTTPVVYATRFSASGGTWSTAAPIETSTATLPTTQGDVVTSINGSRAAIGWLQSNASQNSTYAATYNGSTWSAPTLLSPNLGGAAATPSIAMDANGNVSALFQQADSTGRTWAYLSQLAAATGTWGSAAPLATPAYPGVNTPTVGYDAAGNAIAVWASGGNMFVDRYSHLTATWSAPIQLNTLSATASSPTLAVDAAGNAIVGWVQSDGTAQSAYAARYSASSGTWSAPVSLESSSNAVATAAGSIVTASNGTYGAAAWVQSDGTTNRLYAASWNGTSWSAATIVDAGNGNASAQPDVSVDASGNVTVLWQQSNGTANSIYGNRFNASSATWGGAVLLSNGSSTAANNPQIALDGSGNAFTIWRQGGSLFERYYSVSAQSWSAQATLSVRTNTISAPSLSVDAAGNAVVAWIQSNGTTPVVYATRYSASSSTWSTPVAVESSTATLPTAQGTVVTAINGAYTSVGWLQVNGSQNAAYASSLTGSTWSTPTLLSPNNGIAAATPSISLDAQGNVDLVWQQSSAQLGLIYLQHFNNVATPYYTVKATDTWNSIAQTLYGTTNVASGLQTALGSPSLFTGELLSGLPASLNYTTTSTVTVPPYYAVQTNDSWAHITQLLYGTSDPNAVAVLESAEGSPALLAGAQLTGLPATLSYTQGIVASTSSYLVQPNDTLASITLAVYGTSDPNAVAALGTATNNPTLVAGTQLSVPGTLTYTASAAGSFSTQTQITDPLGNTTTLVNDSQGRLVQLEGPAINGSSPETQFIYGSDGKLDQVTQFVGGTARETVYQYDTNGNLLLSRDADGNTVTRTYDAGDQVLTQTTYAVADPNGSNPLNTASAMTTWYVYDNSERLRFLVSPTGNVTEYLYDARGNRASQLMFTGAQYNVSGLSTTNCPTLAQMTSWAGSQNLMLVDRTDYTYDFRGNLATSVIYGATDSTGAGVASTASTTQYVYNQYGQLLQTIDPLSFSTTYTYDGLGRVLTEVQPIASGVTATTTYQYSDATKTVTRTAPNGLITVWICNADDEVISQSESSGGSSLGTITYTYDADGRLRTVTNPDLVQTHTLYDADGRQVATVDGNGALTQYVYNALGQVVETIGYAGTVNTAALADVSGAPANVSLATLISQANTNPAGNAITRSVYDSAGRLVYSIDDAGAVTQNIYDGAGRLTDVIAYATPVSIPASTGELTQAQVSVTTSNNDRHARNFYDANGNLAGSLDAAGYLTVYQYDDANELITTTAYATATTASLRASGTLAQLIPASSPTQDVVTHYIYDNAGRQVGMVDGDGYLTQTQYDGSGNILATIRYATAVTWTAGASVASLIPAGGSQTTQYVYDEENRLVQETNYQGTMTQYQYDAVGHLISKTTAAGTADARTTQTRYNGLGQVTAQLTPQGSAAITAGMTQTQINAVWAQYSVTYTYDAAGLRTSATDQNGLTTYFYYDEDGRLRFTVDAAGDVTETQYDAFGRVTKQIAYDTAISTSGLTGGRIATTNIASLVVAKASIDSATTTAYGYSAAGRTETTTTAEGASTSVQFDAFGDVASSTKSISSSQSVTTNNVYDARGLLLQSTTDPTGIDAIHKDQYDAFGRVSQSTDADGNITYYTYDQLGREVQTQDGLLVNTYTTYDAFGRVLTSTDGNNNKTSYSYVDSTRTVTVTTADGITVKTTDNEYGQTAQVIDGNGNTTSYTYDTNGDLIKTTDAIGQQSGASFDAAGRLATSTDANGVVTSYAYDAANRVLTKTLDPTGLALITKYGYDAESRTISTTNTSNIVTTTAYDRDGRVTQVAVDPTGLNLVTTYAYDNAGDVLTVTQGAGSSNPRVTQYTYDTLGRRTQQVVDPGTGNNPATGQPYLNLTTKYRYDANGNLVHKIDANGNSTWYVYDADNQLKYTIDALGGITETDYDADGNLAVTRRYATAMTPPSASTDRVLVSQVTPVTSSADRVQRTFYNAEGLAEYTIDAAGTVTQRTYDGAGNVIQLRVISGVALTGTYANTAAVTAALVGTGTATTLGTADRVQWAAYDVRGRAIANIDATGAVTLTQYDGDGNVVSSTAYATLITPPSSFVTSISSQGQTITVNGSATTVASSPNDRTTRNWYDNAGRQIYTLSPAGYLTCTQYSDAGHTQTVTVYAAKPTIPAGASVSDLIKGTNGVVITPSSGTTLSTGQVVGADQSTTTLYDDDGRVSKVTDALNNTQSYTYDALGNKTSYTNQNNQTWTYKYDANGRLIEEDSPYVSVTNVTTSGNALLATPTTSPVSIVTRMTYDSLGNVKTLTEGIEHYSSGTENSFYQRLTTYGYDALGRQVSVTLPAVPVYNGIGSDNVDAAGSNVGPNSTLPTTPLTTHVVYDTLGNEIASEDAAGNWSYKIYDQLGRVTYQIDALNYITGNTYDAFGNQLTTTRYNNPLTGSITGSSLTDLQLQSINGNVATIAVSNGASSSTVQVTASSLDRTITTAYDRDNRVLQVSQPAVYTFLPTANAAGGSTFTASPTTFYHYNAFGQVVRTAVLADTKGNPITNPDVNSGANIWTYSYTYYDQVGNKIADVNAGGFLTTYQYDAEGNLTDHYEYAQAISSASISAYSAPTASSNDRETQYQYDKLNRQVTQTLKAVQSSQITTNGNNQLVASAAAAADVITYYTYDALGNQTSVTLNGATTYTYYDVLGRTIAVIGPPANRGDGTTVTPLTLMGRDVFGNLVSQTQYAAGVTSMPAAGVAPTVTNNTSANADQDRTTLMQVDADGHVLRTEQLLTSKNSGVGNIDQYDSYDADGNLVKQYQAANSTDTVVTFYVYDKLNRQTDVITPEVLGSTNEVTDKFTQYDAFGEVTAKGSGDWSVTQNPNNKVYTEFFFYDAAGRMFLTNTGDGSYRAYLYNLAGNSTGKIESEAGGYNLITSDTQTSASSAYQLYQAGTSGLMFTQTRYDALGNVVEQRLPTFSSPNSNNVINSGEVQVQNVNGTMYLTWYPPTNAALQGTLTVDGASKSFGAIPGSGSGASAEVGYALTGLASGTHTYNIQYTNSGTVVGSATGTFVVGPSLAVTTAATGSVSNLIASFSGNNLVMSWTADATGLSPTVILMSGGTVVQSVTGSVNESTAVSVTMPAPAAGTYQYVIQDTVNGVTEAQGTGTITVTTSGTTTTLGNTTASTGTVSSVTSSVSGSTVTVSWVADSGVANPAFALLIGSTWTSYPPTLTEGNTYTVSFPLPAAGTYQYRITDPVNGVTEAQGVGNITFTAATSTTTLSNSQATTGLVNSVSTSVSGSTASVSWVADGSVTGIAFALFISGNWVSYSPTLSEGGVCTVSFPLPTAGTYQYRITDLNNGVTEAQGVGTVSFTAATSRTTLSNSQATTGLINSVSTSVSGTTATVSWVADSGVTTPALQILIGGNWTNEPATLTEGGVCTASFALPAAGTYQYRITDSVNGVTEAQGTGSITFTAATTTTSLSNSQATTGTINSVSTSVSGSTATVNWVADSGVTTPTFAIFVGGSWVNYNATLTEGGVCTVSFPLPAAGTYQYRITDQVNAVTEAQGTGSISFTAATSNTTTTGSSTPATPWYTPIPVSVSATVGTQGSGTINSSATPAQSPIYNESGQITDYTDYWSGTDSVTLNWLTLASGSYTVNIYYNTAANSTYGITSVASSKSFSVSGGASGTFTWTDPSQVDSFAHGGISSISYFQILQGSTVVRDSRNAGVTTTTVSWAAPSDSSFNGALYYRVTGTSTYTLANATRVGSNFQVALSELTPTTYDFIAQTFQNTAESPTDLSQATGQFSVGASSASIVSQSGTAAYLSGVAVSGNTLTWAQAPNSGDTISVTLVGGSTYSLTPSTSNGTNYSASFYNIPSGTYSYTINYTNSGGTVYRQGSGTVSITTTTTNTPATSSMTAPAQLSTVSGFSDLGNGIFGWTTAANAGDTIVFHYKTHGATTWANTLPVSGSGPYSVNLNGLGSSIDYEIDYTASGAGQPYRVGSGTVTINVTNTAATANASAPTQLLPVSGFADQGNSVFGWTTAANAGDTIVFHYKTSGNSTWQNTLPVSGSGPYSVNLSGLSGSIDYEVDYTASGAGQPYRVGRGTVVITRTVNDTATLSQPSNLLPVTGFSDLGNNVLGWTTQANFGDTIVFHYKPNGATGWVTPSPTVSGSGPYTVSLSGLNGTIQYEVDYIASGATQPYRVGRGVITLGTSIGNVSDTTSAAFAATLASPYELQTVDRWGNVISLTDTSGQTTQYLYNRYNNLIEKIAPSVTVVSVAMQAGGSTGTASTITGTPTSFNYYDLYGRQIGIQDADGNVTEQIYNEANEVITQQDPDGGKKSFVYDAFGDQIQVSTAVNSQTSYLTDSAYDQVGRLTDIEQELVAGTFAAAGVAATGFASTLLQRTANLNVTRTTYTYDGAGRRTATMDGASDVTGTTYDLHGNVIATVTAVGATTRYTYDVNDHETSETDGNGNTQSWQYDYFDHLLSQVDLGGANFTYNYDQASKLLVSMSSTADQYFAGQSKFYHYDAANHLLEIDDQATDSLTVLGYDTAGRVKSQVTVDGGLITENTQTQYDALGRTASLSGIGYSVSYAYDGAGNRTHISATYTNASGITNTQNLWYGYDAMNRVLISQGTNTSNTVGITPIPGGQGTILTYDWRGDRTSAMSQQSGQTPADNGTQDTFDESYTYTYDGAARLTSTSQQSTDLNDATYSTASTIIEERFYDQASRLTKEIDGSISAGGQETIQTNLYNADGTLHSTTTTMGAPNAQQNQSSAVATYDEAGNIQTYQFTAYSGGNVAYTGTDTYTYSHGQSYLQATHVVANGQGGPLGGSTSNTYNADQQLVQYSDAQGPTNDRYFLNNARGQVLGVVQGNDGSYGTNTAYNAAPAAAESAFNTALLTGAALNAGFFYFDSQGNAIGSNGNLSGTFGANFDVNFSPITPQYPSSVPPQYIAEQGDTLGSISMRLYGDASYWYIIAQANGLTGDAPGTALQEGTTLTIPNVAIARSNNAQSFKPFDVTQALGNQTPTQPIPPPPSSGGGCGVFGMILIAVVAIVVTIYTAGLASEADVSLFGAEGAAGGLGSAGLTTTFSAGLDAIGAGAVGATNIAAAAIGGAVGSAVSQGVGIAIGQQSSFSWGQVALGAVGAAAGAELSSLGTYSTALSHVGITNALAQKVATQVINGAAGAAISQGVGVVLGVQKSFNWAGVAAAAVAAPIATYVGGAVGTAVAGATNPMIGRIAGNFVGGLINQVAYQSVTNGKLNFAAIAADSFGNALGNGVVESEVAAAQQEQQREQSMSDSFLAGYNARHPNAAEQLLPTSQILGLVNNPTDSIPSGSQTSPDQQNAGPAPYQIATTPDGAAAVTAPAGTIAGAAPTAGVAGQDDGTETVTVTGYRSSLIPDVGLDWLDRVAIYDQNGKLAQTQRPGFDQLADAVSQNYDRRSHFNASSQTAVDREEIANEIATATGSNAAGQQALAQLTQENNNDTFVYRDPDFGKALLMDYSPYALIRFAANTGLGLLGDAGYGITRYFGGSVQTADSVENHFTRFDLPGGPVTQMVGQSVSPYLQSAKATLGNYVGADNASDLTHLLDFGANVVVGTKFVEPFISSPVLPPARFPELGSDTEAVAGEPEANGTVGTPTTNTAAARLAINRAVGDLAEVDAEADFLNQGLDVTRKVSLTNGSVRAVADIALNGTAGTMVKIPAGFVAEDTAGNLLLDANNNPITSFPLNGQGQAIVEVKTGGATLTTNQAIVYPVVQTGGASGVGANAGAAGMSGSLNPTPVVVIRR
jgi:YD repeat-containing protein